MSEKVKKAGDSQIEKIKDSMLNLNAFLSFSVSHVGEHPDFSEIIKKVYEEFRKPGQKYEKRRPSQVSHNSAPVSLRI